MTDPVMAATVRFTEFEIEIARTVGQSRLEASGYLDAHQSVDRDLTQRQHDELLGALGEFAVAKSLGIIWAPRLGAYRKRVPNVGPFDVSTAGSHRHNLIVRNNAVDGRPIIFVTVDSGTPTVAWLRGWTIPQQAREVGELRNPGGKRSSWFVSPSLLYPMDTLPVPVP